MRPILRLIVLALPLLVAGRVTAQAEPLNVVATTTILADVAANIGGEHVAITPLLPINTDTHAYQFTPQDVARVADADLVLTVGAGYELFLGGLLESAGEVEVVSVSDGIPVLAPLGYHEDNEHAGEANEQAHADEHGAHVLGILGADVVCETDDHDVAGGELHDHAHAACDPHVWMDPANVMTWATHIADAFASADPNHADLYRANAADYITALEALDAELRAQVETLPVDRRVLVTNHEFLGYFAQAYGFDVAATVVPSVSTSAEPNPQALTALIDTLHAEQIPAIFAEVSANSRIAEIVGQEAGVRVVSDLYTESLSAADGPASTYIDYMRHNASAIVDALNAG